MNRRDTIIVAVLLNAAIIAVLLMMAVNTDEELLHDQAEFMTSKMETPLSVDKHSNGDRGLSVVQSEQPKSVSEESARSLTGNGIVVDLESVGFENMLNDYSSAPADLFLVEEDLSLLLEKPTVANSSTVQRPPETDMQGIKIVEVAVKKGDSLDKIARANSTTVEAIKRLSQLKSEKLSIGQILKVPVGSKKVQPEVAQTQTATAPSKALAASDNSSDVVYYTIKSGDNPWKIAKQQRLDMDELLRLNNLNEEKARNLKIGDRIRIR